MGYHIRTGLVKEHDSTLAMILAAVNRDTSLRFDCTTPEHMNKLKYQFNRVLRATSVLIHECSGVYVGLRGRVKVSEDWAGMAIVIKPVIAQIGDTLSTIQPAQPNEYDAIERLKQFQGSMDLIRFTPTDEWDIDEWRLAIQSIGFDLMPNPDEPGWIGGEKEDGTLEYAVNRISKQAPSGFDLLGAFEKEG